ncbi:universal stress protein [Altibacter sp.]|uniref:universal stress protein n=1 Tax=Altibacter sp. TaxID=2024823 RepID=UPI000C90E50B|nr:universal stress protein [Altibacter sp.]MAP55100.1 universal stress protein, UspA family [Altibacter sp.]
MKKILLPTDFSENALNASRYALQFFANETCTFYLLNTFTPAAYNVGMMADSYSALRLQEIVRGNSEKGLERMEKTLTQEFNNPKHSFERIASFNLLVMEMIDLTETQDIDMIVMGTQGATGAKEVFLGTHTTYTIKKVKCPVLAVPSGFHYEAPKEILFPTDYTVSKTNPYLALIKEICKNHVARLNILNAYYGEPLTEEQEDIKDFLDHYFKDNAHLFHIAENTDVLGAIEQFQRKQKINLLVMVHNKHSFFENMLFKPVINQVAYHTNIPFLVVPAEINV